MIGSYGFDESLIGDTSHLGDLQAAFARALGRYANVDEVNSLTAQVYGKSWSEFEDFVRAHYPRQLPTPPAVAAPKVLGFTVTPTTVLVAVVIIGALIWWYEEK